MSQTPISRDMINEHNIPEDSELARKIRALEKDMVLFRRGNALMRNDMRIIQVEMTVPAGNRKFMQIAGPARTVLSITKKHTKKAL